MAVTSSNVGSNASSRRWFFGTNVVVMIGLIVFLVIAINWWGHKHNSRFDLTGGISGYRISDRTKKILDKAGDKVRITTVYASTNPEMSRKEYFPKVADLCEEIRQYKKSIEVQHILSGNDQAKLRDRVEQKFGPAAKEYEAVVSQATELWNKLAEVLHPQQQQLKTLIDGDSWLGRFSTLANIGSVLSKDVKSVEDVRAEVNNLVRGEGLPRYQEANDKIKNFADDVKSHLDQSENWTKEMNKLVKLITNPQDPFIKATQEKLKEMTARMAELRQIIGDPKDQSVPDAPKPILQDFAKAALAFSEILNEENRRVNTFVAQYPAIRQHAKWQIQQGMFVMELPAILASAAEELGNAARDLRQGLQQEGIAVDRMQSTIRKLRGMAAQIGQNMKYWGEMIQAILDEGATIDQVSRDFLAKGSSGELFKEVQTKLNDIKTKIAALPKLELDDIAKKLQQENIVVVESGDNVRVVTFDETWPIADPFGMSMRRPGQDSAPERVFDGDSAVANALFAIESQKSVAEVVLVTFEQEVPPQMRQFQRPMTGPMPLESVRNLREKLERMQFKVTDWNIAAEGAMDKPPQAQEGVPQVFVFLPPPPPPMRQFQQPEQKGWEPSNAEVARRVLTQNGRGIFLGMWMMAPPTMFGPQAPPEYGWGPILRDDWGIKVDNQYRVIRGEVDRQRPGKYGIDIVQWWYMQLSNFTSQPIGSPLRARRMLMKDVCPVVPDKQIPDVEITPILQIPKGPKDIWAEKDLERIFLALQSGSSDGSFTRGADAVEPPFSVAMAAENKMTKSKVVVFGGGLSLRDDYQQQRVVRFGGKGTRLVTDPPPTENVELFTNALYWLVDRPEMIAAGPPEVPRVEPIEESGYWPMKLVIGAWAFAALVLGGVVMLVRRK